MEPRRILLCLCTVSLLGGAGCRKGPTAGSPRLVCEEPVYDFGTRSTLDIIDHSFRIKNMGAAPLRVRRVRYSCMCSVGELPRDALAPGDETTLHVRIHLCGAQGHVNKRLLLESNDPYNPQTMLCVTGAVVHQMEVKPCDLSFLGIYSDTQTSQTVDLDVVDPNLTLNIVQSHSDSPYFRTDVETKRKGKSHTLSVRTVPPLPEGLTTGTIRLVTDNPEHPTIEIPVKADVFGKLVVFPREFLLPADRRQRSQPVRVSVLPGQVTTFHVQAVTVPTPSLTTKITPLAGGGYGIDLTVAAADEDLDGQQLRILTDVDGLGEIRVPIRIMPQD